MTGLPRPVSRPEGRRSRRLPVVELAPAPHPDPAVWREPLLAALSDHLGAELAWAEPPTPLGHQHGPWAFGAVLRRAGNEPLPGPWAGPLVVRLGAGAGDLEREAAALDLSRVARLAAPLVLALVPLKPAAAAPPDLHALVLSAPTGLPLPELIGYNLRQSDELLGGFAAHHADLHDRVRLGAADGDGDGDGSGHADGDGRDAGAGPAGATAEPGDSPGDEDPPGGDVDDPPGPPPLPDLVVTADPATSPVPRLDVAAELDRYDEGTHGERLAWLRDHRPAPGPPVLCHGGYQPLCVFGPGPDRWDSHGGPGQGLTAVNWCGPVWSEREFDVAFTLVAFWSAPFFAPNRSERTALKMIRNTLSNSYRLAYAEVGPLDADGLRFWQAFHTLRGLARFEGGHDGEGSPFAVPDRGPLPAELHPQLERLWAMVTHR